MPCAWKRSAILPSSWPSERQPSAAMSRCSGGTAGMKRCVKPSVRQASTMASGFSRRAAMLTWLEDAFRPRASSFARTLGGLVEMRADRLHVAVAGFGDRIEDAVEILQGSQGVELNRESIRDAHGILRVRGKRARAGCARPAAMLVWSEALAGLRCEQRDLRRRRRRAPGSRPESAFVLPLVRTWTRALAVAAPDHRVGAHGLDDVDLEAGPGARCSKSPGAPGARRGRPPARTRAAVTNG